MFKLIVTVLAMTAAAAGSSDGTDLTIRSNTRLVQVSVVATGHQGRAVLDLTRDEFQLFDNKKRQDIRVFSIDRVGPQSSMLRPSQNSTRTFSNTADDRSIAAGITVIVLDSINTKWTDQAQATRQVLKFLRQVQPGDRVAICAISYSGFRVLHDFTRDASDLVERIARWKGEISRPEKRGMGTDLGGALADVLQGRDEPHLESQFSGDFEIHNNTAATLRAFEAIARRLEGIPGCKNLILISDGFPETEWGALAVTASPTAHDPHGPEIAPTGMPRGSGGSIHDSIGDSESHVTAFLSAAKYFQSNIAIYPIEVRGLLTSLSGSISYQQGTQQMMLDIAKRTGGRAFMNDNDIAAALRDAIEDSRVAYTLGFYPDSGGRDGKFHNITIRLPTRRVVTLRYRSGYVNEAFSPTDFARRGRDLQQAVWSPLDANAIPLNGTLERDGAGRPTLDLKIGVSSLSLVSDDGLRRGEADVLILQRDETGDVLGQVNETIQMGLRDATYSRLLASGVPYRHGIDLDPRATVIRVVVRDVSTGNLGSLTIPASTVSN